MAKCVVFGGDGFIGSHLCESLVAAGHEVRAFDHIHDGIPRNLPQDLPGLELFEGNFLNRDSLARAVDGMDYVFHFISITNPTTSGLDPLADIDTNIRTSVELLMLCADHNVKKVIFPSTSSIYGYLIGEGLAETMLTEPISPYAIGKQTIEGYLRFFKESRGLDHLTFRISNPFGERQNITGSQGVIPIFMNQALQSLPITVYGDGSMTRDYIYIKDVVNIIVDMFEKPTKYPLYNLGSGQGKSVDEILEGVKEVTGLELSISHKPDRPTDVKQILLNVDRLKEETDIAFTPFDSALSRTWDYVKKLDAKK